MLVAVAVAVEVAASSSSSDDAAMATPIAAAMATPATMAPVVSPAPPDCCWLCPALAPPVPVWAACVCAISLQRPHRTKYRPGTSSPGKAENASRDACQNDGVKGIARPSLFLYDPAP